MSKKIRITFLFDKKTTIKKNILIISKIIKNIFLKKYMIIKI